MKLLHMHDGLLELHFAILALHFAILVLCFAIHFAILAVHSEILGWHFEKYIFPKVTHFPNLKRNGLRLNSEKEDQTSLMVVIAHFFSVFQNLK